MFTDVGKSSGGPASSPESDTNRACIVSGTITSSTSTFTRLNLFTLMMNAIYQKQKKLLVLLFVIWNTHVLWTVKSCQYPLPVVSMRGGIPVVVNFNSNFSIFAGDGLAGEYVSVFSTLAVERTYDGMGWECDCVVICMRRDSYHWPWLANSREMLHGELSEMRSN